MMFGGKISNISSLVFIILLILFVNSITPAAARGVNSLVVEKGESMVIEGEDIFVRHNVTVEPDGALILKNASIRRWKGESTEIIMGENSTLAAYSSTINTSGVKGEMIRGIELENSSLTADIISLQATRMHLLSSLVQSTNFTFEGRIAELYSSTISGECINLSSVFMRLDGGEINASSIGLEGAEYINITRSNLTGDLTIKSPFLGAGTLIKITDSYLNWSNLTINGNTSIQIYNTLTVAVTTLSGEPAAGVEVVILDDERNPVKSAMTDQNGNARFNLLAARFTPGSSFPGFFNYTAEANLNGSTTSSSFTIERPLTIRLKEIAPPPTVVVPAEPAPPETFDRGEMVENETSDTSSDTAGNLTGKALGIFLLKAFLILGCVIGGVVGVIALLIRRGGA